VPCPSPATVNPAGSEETISVDSIVCRSIICGLNSSLPRHADREEVPDGRFAYRMKNVYAFLQKAEAHLKQAFEEDAAKMKREAVKDLVKEHLTLRKMKESFQKELRRIEDRYEEVGDLLYGYRSKSFIRSVLFCLDDLKGEYEKDEHYHDLLGSLIGIFTGFEEYDADRRNYTPRELLHLYDEEVE